MTENHIYNLLAQLVEEHKSVWRIKRHYIKEAKGCKKCQAFWKKLEKEKEAVSKGLLRLAQEHLG